MRRLWGQQRRTRCRRRRHRRHMQEAGSTPLPADERGSAAAGALAEESVNGRRPPPDRCVAGARGRVRLPEGGSVQ